MKYIIATVFTIAGVVAGFGVRMWLLSQFATVGTQDLSIGMTIITVLLGIFSDLIASLIGLIGIGVAVFIICKF